MKTCLLALAIALLVCAVASADPLDLLQPCSRPAVGSGGDPFLSALDDRVGWWSDVRFASAPSLRVTFAESDASRPSNGSRLLLGQREAAWTAAGEIRLGSHPVQLAGRFSRPTWEGAWSSSRASLSMDRFRPRVELGLRTVGLLTGLTLQSQLPLWGSDPGWTRQAGGMGARYQTDRLEAQVAWVQSQAAEAIVADVRGVPIEASSNMGSDSRTIDFRLTPRRALVCEGSIHRDVYGAIGNPTALGYALEPRGRGGLEQVSLAWGRTDRGRGIARRTHEALDGECRGLSEGQSFARAAGVRAEVDAWLVGADLTRASGRWLVDWESARAHGQAFAEIESWPFTSILVDLLGENLLGKAQGSARWSQWHAAWQGRLSPRTAIEMGVNWIDAWPEGSILTWQTTFGLIPSGKEFSTLDVGRVQLAALSLGGHRRWRKFEAALAARQVVFARVFRDAPADQPPGSGGTGAAPNATHRKHAWPGGTRIECSLQRTF